MLISLPTQSAKPSELLTRPLLSNNVTITLKVPEYGIVCLLVNAIDSGLVMLNLMPATIQYTTTALFTSTTADTTTTADACYRYPLGRENFRKPFSISFTMILHPEKI